MSKEQYGEQLEENLQGLSQRLRRLGYQPQPTRRSTIPRPGGEKGRPLGISCFEDKLVELAFKRVLEPIYEPLFETNSHGYRPGRSPHDCLDALGRTIQQKWVKHIAEADIKSFFDNTDWGWLRTFIQQRINDCGLLRLIGKCLNAGVMEGDQISYSDAGRGHYGTL